MNLRMLQILSGIVFASLLAACAGMRSDFEMPTVTVNSFRAVPSSGAMPNFEIGLEVVNPNREALALEGISYTISLEGHEIIKGVGNDLPVIEGYGTGEFKLTATANLFAGAQFLGDMMRSPREKFAYQFTAKLDLGGLRPPLRIEDGGTLSSLSSAR